MSRGRPPKFPLWDDGTKTCVRCEERKAESEFSKLVSTRSSRDGLSSYCRDCRNWKERERKYGLTQEEIELLSLEQGHVCAICLDTWEVVDHDHKTGEVRALLCSACNTALGLFGDDIDRILSAAAYLSVRI